LCKREKTSWKVVEGNTLANILGSVDFLSIIRIKIEIMCSNSNLARKYTRDYTKEYCTEDCKEHAEE
jgi:hypothetical protein